MNKTKLPEILVNEFSKHFYKYFASEKAFDLICNYFDLFFRETYEFHWNHKNIKSDDDYEFEKMAEAIEKNLCLVDLNHLVFEHTHSVDYNKEERKILIPLLFKTVGNNDLNQFLVNLYKFLNEIGIVLHGRAHDFDLILRLNKYNDEYNKVLFDFMYNYQKNNSYRVAIHIC